MQCPYCSHPDSKVTDSRVVENGIRRRRECFGCETRFTTYERVQSAALMVSKQDGRREEFSREKLLAGLRKACSKRSVSSATIDRMVDEIISQLQHQGNIEVSTANLGLIVMDRLCALDRVAYIRYASVYRDFQDIESFEKAVRDLRDESQQLPLLDLPPTAPRKGRRRSNAAPLTTVRARTVVNGAEQFGIQQSNDDEDAGRPEEIKETNDDER